MRLLIIALMIGMLLGGCGASMVTNSDMIGGELKGPRWGIIKYLNEGVDGVIQARARSARDLMEKYCSPHSYRATKLTSQSDFIIYGLSGGSFNYIHIRFECV